MKKFAVALAVAALACPVLAQDSCGVGGDTAAPFDQGTAVGAWDTSAQVTTYQVTLSPFQTGMGTQFGICPLVKSSQVETDYFNNMISAQALSRLQIPADGGVYQFGTAAAEFGGDYNGVFGAHVTVNPAQANILNVTRVIAASNSTGAGENTAQIGMGSVDEAGSVMFRADDYGTTGGISGNNIFHVNMPSRNGGMINQLISTGMTDATAGDWIVQSSSTTHAVPNIGPTGVFGQPYFLGSNFNDEYRYGIAGSVTSSSAHLNGYTGQRGTLAYMTKNHPAVGGTHGTCGMIVHDTEGLTSILNVWGLDANGAVAGTPVSLQLPSIITDNATGVTNDNAVPNEFDHYHSQVPYRGGNSQIALNIDPEGNLLVAAVVYAPSDAGSNWPLNHIAVARVAPNGTTDWSIAAINHDHGNTTAGKPIHNVDGTMIGRLIPLDQVTGGSPMGPSFSAPMIDAAGNIWFIGSVNLTHWKDGVERLFPDADGAVIRAVYDAETFSYDLDLILEQGEIFTGIDSGKNWRVNFLSIADSNSVDSATAWSGNIAECTHLNMPVNPEWDSADPHFLGGIILNLSIIYDTNDDTEYNNPTSSYFDPELHADEGYSVLAYIGHLGDDAPAPVDVVDAYSVANHGTAGDLGIQMYPVQLVFGQPYNTESRYGLTQNVLEIGLSDVIADASGITVTATDSAMNVFNATVALAPAGDLLVATFSPVLPDQKIYTISVEGTPVNDMTFEYVTLIGNTVNISGMNVVNSTDRTILNTKLGQAAAVAGTQYDIFRIGTSNGVVDSTDRVILNTKLGNVAN